MLCKNVNRFSTIFSGPRCPIDLKLLQVCQFLYLVDYIKCLHCQQLFCPQPQFCNFPLRSIFSLLWNWSLVIQQVHGYGGLDVNFHTQLKRSTLSAVSREAPFARIVEASNCIALIQDNFGSTIIIFQTMSYDPPKECDYSNVNGFSSEIALNRCL